MTKRPNQTPKPWLIFDVRQKAMHFDDIKSQYTWARFSGQNTANVTYIFVSKTNVARLRGSSDILYIGKTDRSIGSRFSEETNTNNTTGNTQLTNIRLTYIIRQLGISNVECYFTAQLNQATTDCEFVERLRTWDKKKYLLLKRGALEQLSVEKYLLVNYAHDHLEVPPLNNRI